MQKAQALNVMLPNDMAAMVKSKVASGEYATESDVVREGLRTLQARDAAMETWLREEVVKSFDEFAADPLSGIPADEIMSRLSAEYRDRLAKAEP